MILLRFYSLGIFPVSNHVYQQCTATATRTIIATATADHRAPHPPGGRRTIIIGLVCIIPPRRLRWRRRRSGRKNNDHQPPPSWYPRFARVGSRGSSRMRTRPARRRAGNNTFINLTGCIIENDSYTYLVPNQISPYEESFSHHTYAYKYVYIHINVILTHVEYNIIIIYIYIYMCVRARWSYMHNNARTLLPKNVRIAPFHARPRSDVTHRVCADT